MKDWWIYKGTGDPHDGIDRLPPPPSWRTFTGEVPVDRHIERENDLALRRRFGENFRGAAFQSSEDEIELINAALYLRRPLFITGKPGSGKSSLAYAVAYELKLGPVLRWPITTRSTLIDGLYRYDAISRLQDASLATVATPDISRYLRLGPLGTALLPFSRPRVLLIDEIDKSDVDLPNDLLNVFEEGEFEIPELARLSDITQEILIMPYNGLEYHERVPIRNGRVRCHAFPFVVLTSNGEREFPPAFLRRCLRLDMSPPDKEKLTKIVEAHLSSEVLTKAGPLIDNFLSRRERGDLATDQLLNALYLVTRGIEFRDRDMLLNAVLRYLSGAEGL